MKAWVVTDVNHELGNLIVFAATRGKAKYVAQHEDMFEDDLYAFIEIEARRFPKYDQFYDGRAVVDFWENHEHRIRLVRDFGWSCFEVFEELCAFVVQYGKRFRYAVLLGVYNDTTLWG